MIPIKTDAEYWAKKFEEMRLKNPIETRTFRYKCERCQDRYWLDMIGGTVTRCPSCTPMFGIEDPIPPTTPFEFQTAAIANYEHLPGNALAQRALKQFFEVERGDLYVYGGVGTGKTRLACTLLNEYFRKNKTGMFMRVATLLHDLMPSGNGDKAEQVYEAVRTQPLVVLDDLGSERDRASDFTLRTLLILYEERSDRGLRTIWTSNVDLDRLSTVMQDDRLVSRIAGRADIVELQTGDQRARRHRGLGK